MKIGIWVVVAFDTQVLRVESSAGLRWVLLMLQH